MSIFRCYNAPRHFPNLAICEKTPPKRHPSQFRPIPNSEFRIPNSKKWGALQRQHPQIQFILHSALCILHSNRSAFILHFALCILHCALRALSGRTAAASQDKQYRLCPLRRLRRGLRLFRRLYRLPIRQASRAHEETRRSR